MNTHPIDWSQLLVTGALCATVCLIALVSFTREWQRFRLSVRSDREERTHARRRLRRRSLVSALMLMSMLHVFFGINLRIGHDHPQNLVAYWSIPLLYLLIMNLIAVRDLRESRREARRRTEALLREVISGIEDEQERERLERLLPPSGKAD